MGETVAATQHHWQREVQHLVHEHIPRARFVVEVCGDVYSVGVFGRDGLVAVVEVDCSPVESPFYSGPRLHVTNHAAAILLTALRWPE